jgi:hypothetical protein
LKILMYIGVCSKQHVPLLGNDGRFAKNIR